MAQNVLDIYKRTRVVLNDTLQGSGTLYSDDVLLPFVQIANDELSDELVSNGVPLQKEVRAVIAVPVNENELALPDDLIVPLELFERQAGSVNEFDFAPMDRRDFVPNDNPTTTLKYWAWRNQKIYFIGATEAREIRIRYIRTLAAIIGENSPLEATGSLNYLSYKTASLAASSPGGNNLEGDRLGAIANKHLFKLLNINVRNQQATRGRRKPFRVPGIRSTAVAGR